MKVGPVEPKDSRTCVPNWLKSGQKTLEYRADTTQPYVQTERADMRKHGEKKKKEKKSSIVSAT